MSCCPFHLPSLPVPEYLHPAECRLVLYQGESTQEITIISVHLPHHSNVGVLLHKLPYPVELLLNVPLPYVNKVLRVHTAIVPTATGLHLEHHEEL